MQYNKHKKQPDIVIPEDISFPELRSVKSGNGVDLHTLYVEGGVARVSFVFRAGTSTQRVPFSASATANLLQEGTSDLSSKEVAECLDFYGSYFDISVDRDWAVITFCCLSKFFDQTMEIARQILLRPAFLPEEIDTYRSKRKQSLILERSKPSYRARELFAETLFGAGHPYGETSDANFYDTLTREDIMDFYSNAYLSTNCFVVSSGNISGREEQIIGGIVDRLPSKPFVEPSFVPVAARERYAWSEQEGALQSSLRLGVVLFPRTHPDFIPMQIVSTTLGGYFSSRLVRNLREKRGYTYGAYASVVNLQHTGYLGISTEVSTQATDDAIEQIYSEVELLRREIVGGEELRTVKNIMAGEVMRIIDGPFGVADVAIEDIQCGEEPGYAHRFIDRVRRFTAEELLATADKYLSPENFVAVSVGAQKPKVFL